MGACCEDNQKRKKVRRIRDFRLLSKNARGGVNDDDNNSNKLILVARVSIPSDKVSHLSC